MRILLELEALNDQNIWDASEYHKVQGFVYDKLIANTDFSLILAPTFVTTKRAKPPAFR